MEMLPADDETIGYRHPCARNLRSRRQPVESTWCGYGSAGWRPAGFIRTAQRTIGAFMA